MNIYIKWYEKLVIGLFSLFLVIIAIWISVVPLTKSKAFYLYEFKKNDTVEVTGYSMEELEVIAVKIIDYLFNKTDDMQVEINDEIVFSNQALIHMSDVRDLYNDGRTLAFSILFFTIAMGLFIWYNFSRLKKYLFKYTVVIYSLIGLLIIVIGIFAIIDFDLVFDIFHRIIFPNEQKYNDAFFGSVSNYEEIPGVDNLMLIKILSIGLFMDVGIIVGSFAIVVIISWSIVCFIFKKKHNKKEVQNV
ncbi:MAG: DUF1461 domain-containing protein [Bacilli bacterium]